MPRESASTSPLRPDPGDPEGDGLFVAFYGRSVQAMARAVDGIVLPHEIEDVVQEAALKIYRQRRRLGAVENEEAWVTTVAKRVAFSYRKRARRIRHRELPVEIDAPSGAPAIPDVVDARRVLASLEVKLGPRERELLEAVLDRSVTGAADRLGRNANGVRARISGLRARMRRWLQPNESGRGP